MAKKQVSKKVASRSLKNKRIIYSTQAAAISVLVHVLLIAFAGSIAVIEYVRTKNNEIEGTKLNRPKMERRQLVMPVKTKKLQQQTSRPKIKNRMEVAAQSDFAVPDMTGLDDPLGGFDRDADFGDRGISGMGAAGSLGFGISGVNFFGARSKGEKMAFVLGANEEMMTDYKGGFYTYKFAKERIGDLIDGMRSATLFNVFVFNKEDTVMFKDKLVPATRENKDSLKKWLDPINKTDGVVGKLNKIPGKYEPVRTYEDSPLDRMQYFSHSIQAAMEQKADNIFILCGGYGMHHISEEELMERFDIDDIEEWRTSQGWGPEKVAQVNKEADDLEKKARKTLEEENEARAAAGLPKKFIDDIWKYISKEMNVKLERPPKLSSLIPYGYPAEELIEHYEAVYEFNYIPQRLDKPKIHVVKLIASDGVLVDRGDGNRETHYFTQLKQIPKAFSGRFDVLRGANSVEDLLRFNADLNGE